MNKMLTVGTKFSGIGKIPILGGSRLNTLNSIIKAMFANNEQGFAYDPNDLTTLYQDAAGTIPVTAQGQPVGLMLDKSKGLALSPNRCVNGDFSAGLSGWVNNGDHWTIVGGRAYHALGGVLNALDQVITATTATATYLEFTAEVLTAENTAQVQFVPAGKAVNFTTGLHRIAVPVGTTNIQFKRVPSTTAEFYVDNVAVRSVLGNHAYQSVSASRPILQQTHTLGNELITNGDFSDGTTGWSSGKSATLSTANGVLRVTNDPVTPEYGYAWTSFPTTVGKKYYVTARRIAGSANNVSNMHIGTSSVSTQIYNILGNADANKPWLFTATTATTYIGLNAQGNALSGWMEYDDISVKEVTGYRTDQNYLAFDGVDDFLQTNNIDFTATDKVSLFAGVRKLSDATTQMIVESSTGNSVVGVFGILKGGGSTEYFQTLMRGSATWAYATTTNQIYAAPKSVILTARFNMAGSLKQELKINNVLAASSTVVVGNTNFANQPIYIGRRGGASLPFNGHLYSLIGIGRLTTDSETIALEKAIAKNTGVTLNV